MIPTIGISKRVGTYIDRPQLITSAGNITNKNVRVAYSLYGYITFPRKTNTYLASVVCTIPKNFLVFYDNVFT